MAETHPELEAEQAHVDLAYQRLDEARDEAIRLKDMVEVGRGGTNQARWEREIFYENIANRLRQLDLGERSLCFGRIDQSEESGGGSYHIGRIAVAGDTQEPLIVDWRAPVAESFYRATGRDPQGLVRRRHFTSRGRRVLDLEDEFFGDAAGSGRVVVNGRELRGTGALINALEENRTGRLGDIIGTIQAEQDEIIRSALPGVLVVQGGPGTGKTVVALHRAAYLLYAHRFPLEGQGVLVVGPNRLFLGYIEQVLPSLGEAGVELAVLADLVPDVRVTGRDDELAARLKGDLSMVNLVRRAVRTRQRPLRSDLVVGMGVRRIRVPMAETSRIVDEARRRYRTHNAARKFVVQSLFEALAAHHPDGVDADVAREQLADHPDVREALMWMWPVLTPAQLLHDLYGSRSLLRAAGPKLGDDELASLYRPWEEGKDASAVVWTVADVPVLDEAMERLGPKPRNRRNGATDDARTYGHIVVDEAQDLSPMQLRMLTRRSLNGSMTIVGDIAQSTGAWAHGDWDEILEHLPDRREPRRAELTVGYRIPAPVMD
ncbi:MAG: UvrD-helicase domain-containing protein, partial [Actinomycetota bacterium]